MRTKHYLLFIALLLVLFAGGVSACTQRSYDPGAVAKFVGTWQSQDAFVIIDSPPIMIRGTVKDLDNGDTFYFILCEPPCKGLGEYRFSTHDGKLTGYYYWRGDQIWDEFSILDNGHLLMTKTVHFSDGQVSSGSIELSRVIGSPY